jgi:hypothetical protein
MPIPNFTSTISQLAALAVVGALTLGIPLAAQSQAAKEGAAEFEESLFVLNPHLKNPKGVEIPGVLTVVSIPQPIQKYCMGKTSDQCDESTTLGSANC